MCINKKNLVGTVIWCTDKIQLCNHLNFLAVLCKVLERNLELEDLTRYLKVQCGKNGSDLLYIPSIEIIYAYVFIFQNKFV